MLVLSRRVGEQVVIGKDVVVLVTRIGGGKVRLGIDAPQHLPIRRQEPEGKRRQKDEC